MQKWKKYGRFSYLEKSLDEITNVWHPYVKYLNDTRLIMILAPVQMTFHGCYAMGDSLRTVQYYMNGFCVSKHWHLLQAGKETA